MTMTDDSLLKTGNTSGGQSGLRFNPRQTAGDEVGYGVSHTKYNPRNPDEKQDEEDEKAKEKEKRAHAKAGLQHIKIKVKNIKREEEEARKKEAEISDLTGPAASRGGDLDQAVGAKTGTGSAMGGIPPELPVGGAFGQGGAFVRAFAVLKDRASMGTETIGSVRAQERGKKAARTRRQGFMSTGGRGRKGGKPLQTRFRDPSQRARQHVHQRVQEGERAQGSPIISHLYGGGGKRRPSLGMDPREREKRIGRQDEMRDQPTQDVVTPLPTQTGFEAKHTPKIRGRKAGPKMGSGARKPRKPSVPGGAAHSPKLATPIALSYDVLEIGDLLLKRRDFNQSQVFEIRQLLREAKKLLEGLTKKGYMPGQGDDAEGPSPNASRKQTSYNTGATEVDDDWGSPLEWGAHPYGLLVGRRGQP